VEYKVSYVQCVHVTVRMKPRVCPSKSSDVALQFRDKIHENLSKVTRRS